MNISFLDLFGTKKPVIGMLHLDYLEGSPFYKGHEYVVSRAKNDIEKMQRRGIDGIIIENWKEDSIGEFVTPQTAESFMRVCRDISSTITIPFGINVLNNDYRVAFDVAKSVGGSFVELDVLVDEVRSDFSHSTVGVDCPFEIKIDPKNVFEYAKETGAGDIPIICFVQPKHYKMLDLNKTIEESVMQAESVGVAGVLVTKETGFAPTLDLIQRAKKTSKKMVVGIGSGFSEENARQILPLVDFVVVGSALKIDGDADNEVDENKVGRIMELVIKLRKEDGQ